MVTGTSLLNASVGDTVGLASKYRLAAQPIVANATILQKSVTLTGLSAPDKVFDRTTVVPITGTPGLDGLVAGQSLNFSGTAIGTSFDPNVGTWPVLLSGLILADRPGAGGGLASNYSLISPLLQVKINPADDQGVGAALSPIKIGLEETVSIVDGYVVQDGSVIRRSKDASVPVSALFPGKRPSDAFTELGAACVKTDVQILCIVRP